MRGSTRKRRKTWTAYWFVQKFNPETGQLEREQRSKGGFTRQKDAQAHLDEVVPAAKTGTAAEPSTVPLGTFLQAEWLPAAASTVRTTSWEIYASAIRAHVADDEIGAIPLRALSGGHLTALYTRMAENDLAPATIRLAHTALRRALNDAVRLGKLARNPASSATVPKASETRVSAWTAAELRRFLAVVEGDPLFALWRLAATTGMRRGEVLGLTWRCLDLHGARLEVVQQLRPDLTLGPPKTKRSERTVALDAETVEALRRHRATQVLERDFAGTSYDDRDLVFADALGGPIRPQTLTERFARHRKATGVPTGTLHVLRHTAATLALTATPPVPLHIVAARLGDDPRTMLHTYAHLLPQSDVAAAETVAAILAPTSR